MKIKDEEFNKYNNKSKEYQKKLDDLNVLLEKKKREIKNLYEDIDRVTEEINNNKNLYYNNLNNNNINNNNN